MLQTTEEADFGGGHGKAGDISEERRTVQEIIVQV
jgi:hypothetical protein